MITEAINEVKEYLRSKAPDNSQRKRNLIGQKQQQTITSLLLNQNQAPQQTESQNVGANDGSDKGWGKVR